MSVFQRKQQGKSFAFGRNPVPNQTGIRGRVLELLDPVHQKNFTTKEPEYWDPEKTRPKEMVGIVLQTDLRDQPDDEGNDDGVRAVFMTVDYKRGGKLAAVQDALEAARATDVEPGGQLALWFTGYDPESKNPDNPRKLYQATWTPPPAAGGAFQPQQVQQQPPQQVQPQPAQQPPQQGWNPPQQMQQPQQEGFNTGGAMYQPGTLQPQQQSSPPQQQQPAFDQGTGEVFDQPQPGGWNPPPNPAPVPATAPQAAAAPAANTAMIQQMIATGASDADINAATGATQDVIQAVRNLARLQG